MAGHEPRQKVFAYRAAGAARWRTRSNGDPASNDPMQLRLVVNGRMRGGGVEERAGVEEWSPALGSTAHEIRHLSQYEPTKPLKLWIAGDGCPGVSASVGTFLANLDESQSPDFQRSIYYSAITADLVIGRYGDDIYLGTDSQVRRLTLVQMPYGTENLSVSGSQQDTPLLSFPGFTVRFLQEFDGRMFIGLDAGAGASKIVAYDGVSAITDISAIDAPTCAGLYHAPDGGDAMFVGFGSSTNHIRYRIAGFAPGTWVTVTPGAGTIGSNEMVAAGDVLYIASTAGGAGTVWTYNGTTLALTRSPASATACRSVAWQLSSTGPIVYFVWETASAALVGTYDVASTTWTDSAKNLTTQFSGTTSARAVKWYRGFLYVGTTRSGAGRLVVSPAAGGVIGTWTEIVPNVAACGVVNYLMVA